MQETNKLKWSSRLDSFCIFVGAMVPTGLIIGNAGFESMIALVSLGWIIRSIIAKENPLPYLLKHPLVLPWIIWLVSIFVSLIWNGPGSKGWGHDIVLIRYLIFFSALLDISQRRKIMPVLVYGLGAGVLWGLLNTLIAYVVGYDLIGNPWIRYSWKLKEASRIASLAAFAGPFFIALSFQNPRFTRKMKIGTAIIGLIAMMQIFFVNIRTVEIAAFMGILFFIAFEMVGRNKIKRAISFALIFGLLIGILVKFGPTINFDSMYDRFNIWKVAGVMWLEHPILGVSVSAWQDTYKEIANSGVVVPITTVDGKIFWSKETTHSHSLFFQLLSCTGIIGFCSFCWLYINTLRMVFVKPILTWHNGLITWPIVFIAIGLTGWNIFGSQYQTIFVYFMILTAVSRSPKESV